MLTLSVGTLLVQSSLGVWRYPENVGEVIVHVFVVDENEYKTYVVKYGTIITPEAEPTKEGHTFLGWSEIPETMPANDVTIKGSFIVNKYKVTYIIDGEVFATDYVEYGSTIVPPTVSEKEGFTFDGWGKAVSFINEMV